MIERVNCPNCQKAKRALVLDVSGQEDAYLDYLNSKGYLNIDYQNIKRCYFECENCSLVYCSPILEEKEKEVLYEHFRDIEFRRENKEEYFRRITSLPSQESENYEKCKFLENHIPQRGEILDVGCGAGVFLYTFQKYFPRWETFGIEPTPGFADFAKKEGIRVDYGYLTEKSYDQTFELISLIHVLEHIDDPKPVLQMLKKYLNKKSVLYIESPSVKDIGYLPSSHDRFMCQHEVIFSREVLEQILKEQGYNIAASKDFVSVRKRNNIAIIAQLLK